MPTLAGRCPVCQQRTAYCRTLQGELARVARLTARNDTPTNRDKVATAKALLERNRAHLATHQAECKV